MEVGKGSARVEGPWRWIIQLRSFGLEQHELAVHLVSVQDELHFGVGPLLCLVGSVSQIVTSPPPYSPWGISPSKVPVLEGMVLGVHREVVVLGRLGQTLGQCPRDEDSVAFEAEIPVQTPGVVLLDHEAVAGRLLAADGRPIGSGVFFGIPLRAIGIELPRIAPTRGSWRHRPPPYPEPRVGLCNTGYL